MGTQASAGFLTNWASCSFAIYCEHFASDAFQDTRFTVAVRSPPRRSGHSSTTSPHSGPNALGFSGGPPNVVPNTKAIQDLAVGVFPGKPIGGPGMPTTSDPTRTAEDFATQLFGGGSIDKISLGPKCIGCWRAQTSDGAWVTYRPAGQASSHTSPTTATVEVNGPRINAINVKTTGEAEILKLKFPVVSEVP